APTPRCPRRATSSEGLLPARRPVRTTDRARVDVYRAWTRGLRLTSRASEVRGNLEQADDEAPICTPQSLGEALVVVEIRHDPRVEQIRSHRDERFGPGLGQVQRRLLARPDCTENLILQDLLRGRLLPGPSSSLLLGSLFPGPGGGLLLGGLLLGGLLLGGLLLGGLLLGGLLPGP